MMPLASCRKVPDVEAGSSDGIQFSPNLEISADTKTSYSGEGLYQNNVLIKERIDWKNGDLITICSKQASVWDKSLTPWVLVKNASGYSTADYSITSFTTTENTISRAKVAPVGGSGLQWGETGIHQFYGMYPSSKTAGFTVEERSKVGFITPTQIKGTIPQAQSPQWNGNVGTPQMQYAYMWAYGAAVSGAASVNLKFLPMFQAIEFTVESPENESVALTSFSFESQHVLSSWMTGDFTTEIQGRYMVFPFDTVANGSKKITVDLSGKTVTPSDPLKFTIIALPHWYSDVKMSFTGPQIGTRSVILLKSDGTPVSFSDSKKYHVRGISFPKNAIPGGGEEIIWDQKAFGEEILWDEEKEIKWNTVL